MPAAAPTSSAASESQPALLGTVLGVAGIALALGAMLGGAALGVIAAQERASVASRMPPVGPPPPAVAPVASVSAVDEMAEPTDDEDDGDAPLTPSAPRGSRPTPGALDSSHYRVTPGRVTGYRDGRPFQFTVTVLDGKPVEVHTASAFERMRAAASRVGIALRIVSGFRTMEHQRALYAAYQHGGGNLAALPGHSNHQSGHALDLNASTPGVFHWLEQHAREFGFERTVPTERWHWEHW